MPEEMRDLRLSSELCSKAEQMYGKRFGSVEQFLTYVLEQLLRDSAKMDQEELRIIEERLKDLGYI
jgi:hypothetical protein